MAEEQRPCQMENQPCSLKQNNSHGAACSTKNNVTLCNNEDVNGCNSVQNGCRFGGNHGNARIHCQNLGFQHHNHHGHCQRGFDGLQLYGHHGRCQRGFCGRHGEHVGH